MDNNIFQKIDELQQKDEENKKEIISAINNLNANVGNVQKQNPSLTNQLSNTNAHIDLKRFLQTSNKFYGYLGTSADFRKDKTKSISIVMICLLVGVATCIITSCVCNLLSTFSFVEILWLFWEIKFLSYIFHTQKEYDHMNYSYNSCYKFEQNANNLFYPTVMKKGCRIIKILALISAACNIIYVCMQFDGLISVLSIIFETLFFASVFLSLYGYEYVFDGYFYVLYVGRAQSNSQQLTIVQDKVSGRFYTKDEFEKLYPFEKISK